MHTSERPTKRLDERSNLDRPDRSRGKKRGLHGYKRKSKEGMSCCFDRSWPCNLASRLTPREWERTTHEERVILRRNHSHVVVSLMKRLEKTDRLWSQRTRQTSQSKVVSSLSLLRLCYPATTPTGQPQIIKG